jgi:hypothetical protein
MLIALSFDQSSAAFAGSSMPNPDYQPPPSNMTDARVLCCQMAFANHGNNHGTSVVSTCIFLIF